VGERVGHNHQEVKEKWKGKGFQQTRRHEEQHQEEEGGKGEEENNYEKNTTVDNNDNDSNNPQYQCEADDCKAARVVL